MTRTTAASLALLAAAAPASADFVQPDAFGWTRGGADTTYFMWETFTSVAGPNAPAPGGFPETLPPGWTAPDAFDSAIGSFITGGGNIYNPTNPLIITALAPGYALGAGHTTRVLLQVRTQGTEIDPATVAVNGAPPVQSQELHREPLGGFGGFIVETLYLFEIPGSEAQYTVRFDGASSSLSLDRISIDTAVLADTGCPADWNGDTLVNSGDISAFLTTWLQSVQGGDLDADFNADLAVNSGDISAFLTAWLQAVQNGC